MKTGDKVRVVKWEDAVKTKWYFGKSVNYIFESDWPKEGILGQQENDGINIIWQVYVNNNSTYWNIPEELLEVIE